MADTTSGAMAVDLQEHMVALIRAFGLHEQDRTPCGEPMTVSEAHALMELEQQGSLSQNQLAACLRLEKSTVSRLIAQVQRRGWVDRDQAPYDGRVQLLTLTGAGQDAARSLAEARRIKYERLLEAIPEKERGTVLYAFHVVTSALNETTAESMEVRNQTTEAFHATD